MVPLARSPSTVPSKQTVPPAVPAPGPRSMTWSAIAMVSGLCGVPADRLVRVEEARFGEDPHCPPAVHLVAGDGDRALGERLGVIEELGEVDVGDRAPAFAARTHAAGTGEGLSHGLASTAFDRDRTARPDRGDVEGERGGRADVRPPESAEQDAQHRVGVEQDAQHRVGVGVGVGGGADGGAGVSTHPLLVDDDRGRQPVEYVDLGPRQRRHEALYEAL
jgi:hypothetical protein